MSGLPRCQLDSSSLHQGGRLARTVGVLVGDVRRGLSLLGVGASGRGLRESVESSAERESGVSGREGEAERGKGKG